MKYFLLFCLLIPGLLVQAQVNDNSIKFLALGDSYTIGESVPEPERWPEQLASELRNRGVKVEKPRIIAVTGWRTDQLKKAILDAQLKNEYGMVSLLIGVNNQYQGRTSASYAPEFEELLNMAVTLAQGRKENVFVVSIPDYGYTPFGKPKQESISKAIDEFNAVNRSICQK
ncbi:MAG: SGNH/GDSL hydrolase family protein, partial [Bacteroidetes bacterium]|nr:SGNH/GDSL hydrolase family protein [Bacteroidota bacterium]